MKNSDNFGFDRFIVNVDKLDFDELYCPSKQFNCCSSCTNFMGNYSSLTDSEKVDFMTLMTSNLIFLIENILASKSFQA